METSRFKDMWESMQSNGYFENSAQYDDVQNPLHRRPNNALDKLVMSLDYSGTRLELPKSYSKDLEASMLHTEGYWLPRMFNLPSGGLAVDLGCGYGRSEVWLKDRFDTVLGLDISETIVERARQIFDGISNVSFALAVGDRFPDIIQPHSVDFIYAFTVFQHIPREYTASYLSDARLRLLKGGVIAFNLISDLNEDISAGEYGTEWLIGYSEEAARKLVQDSGLHLDKLVRWTAPGAPASWLWISAKAN